MMRTVNIDKLVIGNDKPKICVPVVAKDIETAMEQASRISGLKTDIIEVRGDYFDKYSDVAYVTELICEVKKIVKKPVIYTFRTGREGGERDISGDEYEQLIGGVIERGAAELVDIELFSGESIVKHLVAMAEKCGVKVIMSNHDFEKTPDKEEIIARLVKMQDLGADIAKIAVMPNSRLDVNILLEATTLASERLQIPIVTMSMGKLGVVSRITGEIFGSSITFGTAGKASAPGQMAADELDDILEMIHKNCI